MKIIDQWLGKWYRNQNVSFRACNYFVRRCVGLHLMEKILGETSGKNSALL